MSILGHFGDHLGPWGRHGDSKWPSKGPAREPKEVLEPWEKAGRKSYDFGGSRGGVGACSRFFFAHCFVLFCVVVFVRCFIVLECFWGAFWDPKLPQNAYMSFSDLY